MAQSPVRAIAFYPFANNQLDHTALFDVHREATAKVIKNAVRGEPTIDWLLANQDKVEHYFGRYRRVEP